MQGGDGWVRWFSVFSVCLLEETARETFGHEQTLCHFLKKKLWSISRSFSCS